MLLPGFKDDFTKRLWFRRKIEQRLSTMRGCLVFFAEVYVNLKTLKDPQTTAEKRNEVVERIASTMALAFFGPARKAFTKLHRSDADLRENELTRSLLLVLAEQDQASRWTLVQ